MTSSTEILLHKAGCTPVTSDVVQQQLHTFTLRGSSCVRLVALDHANQVVLHKAATFMSCEVILRISDCSHACRVVAVIYDGMHTLHMPK